MLTSDSDQTNKQILQERALRHTWHLKYTKEKNTLELRLTCLLQESFFILWWSEDLVSIKLKHQIHITNIWLLENAIIFGKSILIPSETVKKPIQMNGMTLSIECFSTNLLTEWPLLKSKLILGTTFQFQLSHRLKKNSDRDMIWSTQLMEEGIFLTK